MARPRGRLPWPVVASALLAAALYLNALGGGFVYDDVVEIRDNERIHSLARIPELIATDFWNAGEGRNPLYRPLTAVLYTLLWLAGGGAPWLYHLFNLLLHAAASAAAAALVMALTQAHPWSRAAGWVGGLLFAAHPIHSEAVGWISGQAELTSSLCVILAWLAHLRGRTALALGCLVPGLLCKEGSVVFPALALAGDLALARDLRARVTPYLLYGAAVAGYLGVRGAVLGHIFGGVAEGPPLLNPLREAGMLERILTSFSIFGRAAGQVGWPATLCLDYGFDQIPIVRSPADAALLLALGALAATAALVWLAGRLHGAAGGRLALLGVAIFGLTFLPASNLLVPAISIFAERNLYLPLLGGSLLAGLLLGGRGWRAGLAAILVLAASARTVARNPEFDSSLTLFGAAVESCPRSARVRLFHGIALREAGRVEEALRAQESALAIAPRYADARAELGLDHMLLGDRAAAEAALRQAMADNDEDREARSNLAYILMETGRADEALREYETNARMNPDDPDVLGNLASALLETGSVDRARPLFEKLTREYPESPQGPNGEGALFARDGAWDRAADRFAEALRRKPADVNAAYNLAQALSRAGQTGRAIEVIDAALAAGAHDEGLLELRRQLANPPR